MSAKQQMVFSPQDEQALMSFLWSPQIKDDPYSFVMAAYPWGKPNTPLTHRKGPRKWQKDILLSIRDHIKHNKIRGIEGKTPELLRTAVASGRGIGKSAIIAWLSHWFVSCVIGGSCVLAANTEAQLRTRTMAEVSKWVAMGINSHWFEATAMFIRPADWFAQLVRDQIKVDTQYWYVSAQPWSEEKPDAFAGLHNTYGIVLMFDEASGIPQNIYTVSQGFFTEATDYRFWLCFSNPRKASGPFFECFHKNRHMWSTYNIDSRTVEDTDLSIAQAYINEYGEDSDEARYEVYGQFPQQSEDAFIPRNYVFDAQNRETIADDGAPLIMGIDVGRTGPDPTVVRFRKGRDARSIAPIRWRDKDNVYSANRIATIIDEKRPDAVFIDGNGVGAGVYDILRDAGYNVTSVQFGGASTNRTYFNKRTQIYADMRDWLKIGCIDKDLILQSDLTSVGFYFIKGSDKINLESKDDMKARGLSSPNDGDALAMTFAAPVARKDAPLNRGKRKIKIAHGTNCQVFSKK